MWKCLSVGYWLDITEPSESIFMITHRKNNSIIRYITNDISKMIFTSWIKVFPYWRRIIALRIWFFCLVQERQIYFHQVLYTKCSLRRINWVNHNLTCAGCQDPANELHVLSIGCKRRKQWLDNNNGSASIKQTMGGEDCNFCCDLNKFLYDVVEL